MGEVYAIDPTLVRLGAVFLGLITAIVPLIVVYVIGWIVIPKGPLQSPLPSS